MRQDQNLQPSAPSSASHRGGLLAFGVTAAVLAAILAATFRTLPWDALAYSFSNMAFLLGKPWLFPTRSAVGLAVGGAEIAALFGLGYGLVSLIRPWRRMLPLVSERAALALPVVAVPVSLAVLGLGLAGLTQRITYQFLLGAMFLVGLVGWGCLLRDLRRGGARAARRWLATQPAWGLIVTGIILILSLIYSLTPATESDELRYHLAAPATWLRDGRIHYIPFQAFSNFPMLGEMLFMPALALGGDEAAKPLHLAFLPVCVLLTGLTALRLIGRRSEGRLPAGLAFALITTVPILGAWGWIDLCVTAYLLAFVYLTGRALERPGRAAGSLIGLIAGGGIATKYTMLALLGGLGMAWSLALALRRTNRRHAARLIGAVVLLTLLGGGAWYVKNACWTGNPFYPGAWSILGGGDWSQANTDFFIWKAHNNTGMNYTWASGPAGKLGEFFLTPLTATFIPERFENNALGPLPLMALVLGLGWLLARSGAPVRARSPRLFMIWIMTAAAFCWVVWFKTYQSNRFLLPTAALVLALGARADAQWRQVLPALPARLLRGLWALGLLSAFLILLAQFMASWKNPGPLRNKADALAVALGFEDRETYLAQRLNYWRAAQWLGRRARPGEKALLVGEHRTLHFELPVVASDWFDTPQPLPWMRQTKTNDEMLDLLARQGVRYIFYNQAELVFQDRAVRILQRRFSFEERTRFMRLWGNPRLNGVYPAAQRDGIQIFEIRSRGNGN